MHQHDLNRLKRAIAERMLFQMRDEALGELIINMKEMLEFYGQRTAEEKIASLRPASTQPVVSKPQPATQPALVQPVTAQPVVAQPAYAVVQTKVGK